jgi:hypothetical protein
MNAAERQMRARIAGHTSWANTVNRSARTLPARIALEEKFARIGDNTLPTERRELRPRVCGYIGRTEVSREDSTRTLTYITNDDDVQWPLLAAQTDVGTRRRGRRPLPR